MSESDDAPEQLPDPAPAAIGTQRSGLRRTWPQRLVLAFNVSVAFACLLAAGTIWYANDQLSQRKLVDISGRAGIDETVPNPTVVTSDQSGSTAPEPGESTVAPTTSPDTTFPASIDPTAKNFLLTGSDNRSCIDPNSPYAGAFLGDGSDTGERSDTVMMLRVDPTTNQAIALSFPRDLWVKIAGSNKKSRINAAFDTENPTKLPDTIWENFGILTDHYINVDFCAFKGIVDAVGGVAVPFEFAAKDANTGLNIPGPECHVFEGDEALAYVRSRHYKWFNPVKNSWVTDGTSDYGRITRQQDFLKRAIQKALDKGATNPVVANNLIQAFKTNVTVDTTLTVDVMLQLAGAMRNFNPEGLRTYQIAGTGVIKGNAQVIEPNLSGDSMKAVLAVFRGLATLADAPTGPVDPGDIAVGPVDTAVDATPTTTSPVPSTVATSSTTPGPTTSAPPTVAVDDVNRGIFPPDDPTCR